MNWQSLPGWFFWREGQEQAVRHFPEGSRFLEVGLFLGRSICSLGEVVRDSGRRFTVIGIDTCRGSGAEGPAGNDNHAKAVRDGGGTFAGQLHRNVIDCGLADVVNIIVADSAVAADFFPDESLEWIHIDASHDYESVCRDIRCWLPKVKYNGWLSGDDYIESVWPGVVRAVKELLPNHRPWLFNQWLYVKE